MTNSHPLAALIAGVKVKDFEVEIVRGNVGGNLALYFNDYRVAGSKPWGGGTTIHKFRVQGDDVKSSGILATIRDFQNVPVVKECLTTDAALEAAQVNETPKSEHDAGNVLTVPDLVEAGKVLEGVTPGPWQEITPTDDIWPPRVFAGSTLICMVDNSDMHNSEKRANARFIAWCREGVPTLIALATAQAAQIAGLQRTYDELYADALADAKSDAQDFDSDLWIEARKYLTELHLDWRDYDEDGILAEQAIEHIRECMDEETRRAEAAEAKVAELEAQIAGMIDADTVQKMLDSAQPIMAEACRGYEETIADLQAEAATLRAEVERLRGALRQAHEALLWCARDGRMASPSLHQYPAKWADEARAALEGEKPDKWQCPINYPGCKKNCGGYGCGN